MCEVGGGWHRESAFPVIAGAAARERKRAADDRSGRYDDTRLTLPVVSGLVRVPRYESSGAVGKQGRKEAVLDRVLEADARCS